ncbi:hypothetical protein ABGB17_29540 [Sphaerisporangium sp. B11E5]|uniref:hypothetical protein n=1 Tax=Sphaerisporangium sp. B11E5 TaxID=3153563 RepID=UPI00325D22DA
MGHRRERWAGSAILSVVVLACLVVPFVAGTAGFGLGFWASLGAFFAGCAVVLLAQRTSPLRTVGDLLAHVVHVGLMFLMGLALVAVGLGPDERAWPWGALAVVGFSWFAAIFLLSPVARLLHRLATNLLFVRRSPEAVLMSHALAALDLAERSPSSQDRLRLARLLAAMAVLVRRDLPRALRTPDRAVQAMLQARCAQAALAIQEYEGQAVLPAAGTRRTLSDDLRRLAAAVITATYGDLPEPATGQTETRWRLAAALRMLRLGATACLGPALIVVLDRWFTPSWWQEYREAAVIGAVLWGLGTVYAMLNPHYRDPLEVAHSIRGLISGENRSA